MDHEISSSCLEQPSTGHYAEPAELTPLFKNDFINIHFNIILLITSTSSKWSLSFRNSNQNFWTHTFFPCSLHVYAQQSSLVSSP
jgi:hypothetical protein